MIRAYASVLLLLTLLTVDRCFAASPHIIYADTNTIKRKIASDKGHVVLVNFWATWCTECVAEYPSIVHLDNKYRSSGLDVIGVSLDFPDDIPGKVKPFLARQKATFPQFVLKVEDPEAAIDAFDTSWQGDLPRTFVYSKTGKLIATLPDQQTYQSFEKAVQKGYRAR